MHMIFPHHTHEMTDWRDTIVTLVATPRFGRVRECASCGSQQSQTGAGQGMDEELKYACAGGKTRWLERFQAEYLRRVGMTVGDGGMDGDDALEKYYPADTPSEAVDQEIEKYGLEDLDRL